MMRTFLLSALGVCTVITISASAQSGGITPVATISQIQRAMVSPSSDVIFSIGSQEPETDADWQAFEDAAVILTEAGNLFMMDGRKKDDGLWMELAGAMSEAGAAALTAAEARDVAGVFAAGNPLNELADSIAFKESQSRITKNKNKIEENPTLFDETLSHVDQTGNASMVDVGAKSSTFRVAKAEGWVHMKPATLNLIKENSIGKGDVLSVAKVAGIMASKKTSDLIPLCHPIPVDKVSVEIVIDESKNAIHVVSDASTHSKTGIEMEALIAVSISCLTIYDMCKSAERTIKIDGIRLLKKTGGKHTYEI